ncbi:hypothetical protein GCM10023238_04160 [Streptomyces heliomycini]
MRVAARAGLWPDGSGRVACPFGYADADSAVRGLKSTGLFDPAVMATDQAQVDKELAEALHPYQRQDGTVWGCRTCSGTSSPALPEARDTRAGETRRTRHRGAPLPTRGRPGAVTTGSQPMTS